MVHTVVVVHRWLSSMFTMRGPCQTNGLRVCRRLLAAIRPRERPSAHLEPRRRTVGAEHEGHELAALPPLIPPNAERVVLPMLECALERSHTEPQILAC